MSEESALVAFARAPLEVQQKLLRRLTMPQKRELRERWKAWRHPGQEPPGGDWRTWLIMAGRGFGKTRAGAEWVGALARADGRLRIALVGATIEDVRKVMVEGEAALMRTARVDEDMIWVPGNGELTFQSGAMAFAYSGESPEKLRGPEHHFAWCDEIAKWRYPDATWHNLQLGLRLGEAARVLVTTTPRPMPLLKQWDDDPGVPVSRGRSADNHNLPDDYLARMNAAYGGTRRGRQEMDGELFDDVENAMWSRALIEACRVRAAPALVRIVLGVDSPASAGGDACGIVAVGKGADGLAYVLGDHSVAGLSPEAWARAVADAAARHGADRVVAEKNNGGDMVESVLRGAELSLPLTLVHASRGKAARAEPVLTLFEKGRAKFAGAFPALEDELAGLQTGGLYQGPGRSPDRADAMVWALTELMLGKHARVPRVMGL